MRVEISPLAERDLESIGDYIAEDNPVRALRFVAELRTSLRQNCQGAAVISRSPGTG